MPPGRVPLKYFYLAFAIVLGLCLCSSLVGVFVWDRSKPSATPSITAPPPTTVTAAPTTPSRSPTPLAPPVITPPTRDATPTIAYAGQVVALKTMSNGRFGLATTIGDPRRQDDDNKNLTFDVNGRTNNTRIFVDGDTPIFGEAPGILLAPAHTEGGRQVTDWQYNKIFVAQRLAIVLGASTNLYDTLRVEYTIDNRDAVAHDVGLRLMIDTLIGDNDGVPFRVPGVSGIVNRAAELQDKSIPDFIQVLEKESTVDAGVIINVTLRGADTSTPERVLITGWRGDAQWDYLQSVGGLGAPLTRYGTIDTGDSAVGLFFPIQSLGAGERRTIVTYYGLGAISSTETKNPSLGLSVSSNRVEQDASFWVIASIGNPRVGQSVVLSLPPQMELVDGTLSQTVAPEASASFTTRSWLVRAKTPGAGLKLLVQLTPDNIREDRVIEILARPTPTVTPTSRPTAIATPSLTATRSIVR